jgi:hypothetical protein
VFHPKAPENKGVNTLPGVGISGPNRGSAVALLRATTPLIDSASQVQREKKNPIQIAVFSPGGDFQ